MLDLLLLGLNPGGSLHAVELLLFDDDCLGLLTFLSLLADVAEVFFGEGGSTASLSLVLGIS